jgi:hypothetical protein
MYIKTTYVAIVVEFYQTVSKVIVLLVATRVYYFNGITQFNQYWKYWPYRGDKAIGCVLYINQ